MNETKEASSSANVPAARITRKQAAYIAISTICLFAAAVAHALISLPNVENLAKLSPPQPVDQAELIFRLIFTCALVATVEEIIFRGILPRALLRILKPKAVILITAGVFAILHGIPIGIENTMSVDPFLVAISMALKAVQAFAFGILMAAFVLCGLNLLGVIVIHAVFDLIYFERYVSIIGDFPATYIAASPDALVALVVSVAIIAVPAAFAFRTI